MKRALQFLTLLSATLLLRPSTTASGADCYLECLQRSGCFSGQTGQNCGFDNSHIMEMCNIRCKGVTSNAFGAIAYSRKEKISGWSYDQNDKATAERVALQNCAKAGGAKCLIEASINKSCASIAADGDIVTWGSSGTTYDAQQRALAECKRVGGKACAIQARVCSSPGAGGGSQLPSSVLPPRASSWGAIAYSVKDMAAGYSQGKDDRASAEKEAMDTCAQRGKACVLRTSFNKECAALAADRDVAGWATSADQLQAQQKAIDDCKKAGGARCVLHISYCSR